MRNHGTDMTQGSIFRHFMHFAIPMMIGLLFQQLYNTVDTLVVGQFVSTQALAAVGNTGNIINLFVGLCAGLSTGASVTISQAYGAHDYKRLHDAVHTTILVTLILCAIATVGALLLIDPLLRLMEMPSDVYGDAKTYLTIYFEGLTGLLIYNMGGGILRAVGDSRRPLLFLVFSAIVNTALDLTFVLAFHMGVEGVAYATIMAQGLSASLILWVLTREQAPYAIHWNQLSIRKEVLRDILKIGLPSGFQQALTSFSNVFVQSYINAFGAAGMAGYSIYNKLDQFVLIPVQGLALTTTTFVGQNYGAGNYKRTKEGTHKALLYSLLATAVLATLLLIFHRSIISLFSDDPEVLDYGSRFLMIITPFYLTICFNQNYAGALRGIGSAQLPMAVMIFSFVIFRQIYLYTSKLLGGGFLSVALAYPLGWVLCSILLAICFYRSKLYQKQH